MNTRKGFTLVELLVVIAILAILSTVAVVGYTSYITKAEQQAAQTEAAHIEDAIVIALVSNPKASIVVNGTTTIYVERDGNGFKVVTPAAADQGKYPKIENIGSELTARLSAPSGALLYTSGKGVIVNVHTNEVQ